MFLPVPTVDHTPHVVFPVVHAQNIFDESSVIPEPVPATTTPPEVPKYGPCDTRNPKYDYTACHCVAWLRVKGIDIKGVDAKWFVNFNGSSPKIGVVVVLKYDSLYHVAYLEKFTADGSSLVISETNYRRGQYTTRTIALNDPHIVKFVDL